jgi:homogentisate solanesyltransferase
MMARGFYGPDAVVSAKRVLSHDRWNCLFLLAILPITVIQIPQSINGFTVNGAVGTHNPSMSLLVRESLRSCIDVKPNEHCPHRSVPSRTAAARITPIRLHSSTSTSSAILDGEDSDDDNGGGGVESYGSIRSTGSSMIMGQLLALYKFTRPHTIRGTILASICGTIRALRDTPHWYVIGAASAGSVAATVTSGNILHIVRDMLPRALIGMIALLFGNAFIVGINQIYDQSIDKMNKPFLPIVSGEMNPTTAWVIITLSAILGPILVYNYFPNILFQLYTFGLFLGLIYSVPPIRTKQNPILAGLTIACVRGLLLNFGVYYAVKDTLARNSFTWSPHVSFIARFMTIFASIIAITKDLPDIEGDKANQIETFVTKFGIAKIAKGATGLLFLNYIHAIITGIVQRTTFAPLPMIGGHIVLASILLYRYRQLQPNSMASVKRFYKHIWDLFYLEYGLYTLI